LDALGIRQIDFQILVEQGDGAVRRRGAQVLNVVRGRYSHAAMISLANCTDPAFLRLRTALVTWFRVP
jgi:hypothetical protein